VTQLPVLEEWFWQVPQQELSQQTQGQAIPKLKQVKLTTGQLVQKASPDVPAILVQPAQLNEHPDPHRSSLVSEYP
jgi:Trm5-related predicted tRNA methylase